MVKRVDPLSWNVPIVDDSGRPTQEFTRKWAEQANINGQVPTTLAAMSGALDLIGKTVGAFLVRGVTLWGMLVPSAANKVLKDNGIGNSPSWDTLSNVVDATMGNTRGSLLWRGATGWQPLTPSAANKILKDGGAGADPSWATLTGLLDTIGATQGTILYRGASSWSVLAVGTSGQFLKTLGAGANPAWADVTTGNNGPGFHPGFVAGRYYFPLSTVDSGTSGAATANTLQAMLFYVPAAQTFNEIGVNCGTGVSGSSISFGVYNNLNGYPTSLVRDCGIVSTATSGTKAITGLALALPAGWYWLALASSSTPSLRRGVSGVIVPANFLVGGASDTAPSNSSGLQVTSAYGTGAMPGTFPAGATYLNTPWHVYLRAI